MQRFFFDIDDGELHTHDTDGHAMTDCWAARNEAIRVLPSLARDQLPDAHDRRDFTVRVRDGEGLYVFQATLSLFAGWLVEPAAR